MELTVHAEVVLPLATGRYVPFVPGDVVSLDDLTPQMRARIEAEDPLLKPLLG